MGSPSFGLRSPSKGNLVESENAPQGPFQIPQGSRKAGESFISPAGGLKTYLLFSAKRCTIEPKWFCFYGEEI